MRRNFRRTAGISVLCVVLMSVFLLGLLANKAADVYSMSRINESRVCIIIDPGHGGVDGGAVSCTGVYESHINLEISLRLNDLMKLLGYKTKMIRTDDISVYNSGETIAEKKISDLKERVRMINETENGVLISIHQNYFQDARYHGAQVFYTAGSQDFARKVQSLLLNTLNPDSNRKVKKASGIYLMDHLKCPGILVECGFLSNQSEENKLRDPHYQKRLCCVIASGTVQYINDSALA